MASSEQQQKNEKVQILRLKFINTILSANE